MCCNYPILKKSRICSDAIGWNICYNNMLEYSEIKGNFDNDKIESFDDQCVPPETRTAVTICRIAPTVA